jgi:cobyrinic acid a,c-diamide synthase
LKNSADKLSAFCIAGTASGDGKTTVTLALLRALLRRKLKVQPFKCGPDYIDPAFHRAAALCDSRNLDFWMMGDAGVESSYRINSAGADCAVIEGVMGMFDGVSPVSLSGSTAEVALRLKVPVILTVNASGTSGTIAAIVKGFVDFCPEVNIIGVIANRVSSEAHAALLREALDAHKLPPLLGRLPNKPEWALPERHLGLVPFSENEKTEQWFEMLAAAAEQYIDIDRILALSTAVRQPVPEIKITPPTVRLGIALDEVFHFYYTDNLDMLRRSGIELVEFSPLHDAALPENLRGIYLGGGFPEMFAAQLAENTSMRQSIKHFADQGGIIYAECGGYMYLTESIAGSDGKPFPMCGIIPGITTMGERLGPFGYRELTAVNECCFGPAGVKLRGHEFHWSNVAFKQEVAPLWSGHGCRNNDAVNSGYCSPNVFASYIHLHFASNPGVLDAFRNFLSSYTL